MSTFTLAAVEARKLAGEMVPMDASQAGAGKLAFTLRQPIGVVGAISPFNFPLNLVAHKIAPALAAGCAVVLKPASQTPLLGAPARGARDRGGPAAGLAERPRRAGRPRSATCSSRTSASARSPSPAPGDVGWKLAERAPRKRVKLELGNATPVIVEADADLEDVATRLAANAFSFAGQSCISVQRIYVERAAYDDLLERFLPKVEALVVGDPLDEATDVGPLIDADARDRVLAWIEEARAAGRGDPRRRRPRRRRLLRPTVIANAAPDLKVSCEEVFGPVCTVTAYDTLDEAIELANGTRYGLQAGIFTSDVRPRSRRRSGSSSAASRSTRRRPSAPTRCPTAASRTPATRARGRPTRCAS